jgi:hypothetical protein
VLQQTNWAPPVMDGMVRTIACDDLRGEAENGYFVGHFSDAVTQLSPAFAPRLNVTDWVDSGHSAQSSAGCRMISQCVAGVGERWDGRNRPGKMELSAPESRTTAMILWDFRSAFYRWFGRSGPNPQAKAPHSCPARSPHISR